MTKQILVIDDEADLRELIQVALVGYAGWQVQTAATCQQGLCQALDDKPDLILLDISMPDVDGYQCFKQFQAEPELAAIPVIVLTARVQRQDHRKVTEMGIAGVIIKPFNPLSLWQDISGMVGWEV
jgi:DNA-binding response OmpR family regulator